MVHGIEKTRPPMARRTVRSLFRRRSQQSTVQGLGNRPGKPGYRGHQRPRNERLPGVDRCAEFAITPTGSSSSMAGAGRGAAVDLVVQCPVCRADDSSPTGSHCRGGGGVSRGVRISFQAGEKGSPQNSPDGPGAGACGHSTEYEHSQIYRRGGLELASSDSVRGGKGFYAASLAHF